MTYAKVWNMPAVWNKISAHDFPLKSSVQLAHLHLTRQKPFGLFGLLGEFMGTEESPCGCVRFCMHCSHLYLCECCVCVCVFVRMHACLHGCIHNSVCVCLCVHTYIQMLVGCAIISCLAFQLGNGSALLSCVCVWERDRLATKLPSGEVGNLAGWSSDWCNHSRQYHTSLISWVLQAYRWVSHITEEVMELQR